MSSTLSSPATATPASDGAARSRRLGGILTLPEVRWASLATALFAVGGLSQLLGAPAAVYWALYLACYAAGGWEPALAGLKALRRRTLDVDLLMIVAAIVAAAIGQVLDGALLIVIFSTSGALEAFATKRTQDSVKALLDLAPEQATRVLADGTEELIDTAVLEVGDHVLVRPGERIGADGYVVDGASDVDQATITGEPLPVVKEVGHEVFAGTLNGTGALRVRVARRAQESVVARIVALVDEASATKARTQLFIDKIEQRYSLLMVSATLALFFIPLALGSALQPTLLRAITFMIVASPCAVVLATMPPLLSAIANAGRHGVLVKSAVVMEQLALTDVVAFDKTGTLTEGTPQVTEVHVLPDAELTQDQLLALAAGAERPSEHPLAAAIVRAAHDRDLTIPAAFHFSSAPGRGVSATVAGLGVHVSSPAVLAELSSRGGLIPRQAANLVAMAQERALTAVVVVVDGRPVGVLALSDRLRTDAADTVAQLRRLTGTAPVLLTGDNAAAAIRLGIEVGITDVRAGLLPADKVTAVQSMQQQGSRVLLVGDGVNDAPAMAAAHLGVAMGRHGSDLAMETADAVIVRDELSTVPKIIDLARRARQVVVANLVIAGAVIAGLVIWDLVGTLPLPLGVAGHEGSTIIVGLNGLRLLRTAAWRRAGSPDAPVLPVIG
ncbi:heavy metal translocating P-type ATPase [Nakamurella sp. UYEF19]|uniref:heavy metal translocating P-type ATPase n=1 Tax=Nakamurella sp. UYEF19 TaxID=1756392 RepID=UPI0033945DD0